jgi:GAF domain
LSRVLSVASLSAAIALKLASERAKYETVPGAFFLFDNAYWLAPLLLVLVPILEWARRWAERQTLWTMVKPLLEDFRSKLYPNSKDPHFYHRVTLFKRTRMVLRWRALFWPKFGWTKIVERSGHTTQDSWTVFRAPNRPELAEGIAGTTWANNQLTVVENLPDLQVNNWQALVTSYSLDTKCPEKEILRRHPFSRSICGFPVLVRGHVWGVVVVDSRNPQFPRKNFQTHHAMFATMLGRVLERLS